MSEYDETAAQTMQEPPIDAAPRKPRARRAPVPQPVNAASPAEALRALAALVAVLMNTMPSDARDEAEVFLRTVDRL